MRKDELKSWLEAREAAYQLFPTETVAAAITVVMMFGGDLRRGVNALMRIADAMEKDVNRGSIGQGH